MLRFIVITILIAYAGYTRAQVPVNSLKPDWTFTSGGSVRGTAVATERYLLFGSADHYFYCIDKISGKLKWKFATKGAVHCTPIVVNKTVYITSRDQHIYALDLGTGQLKWKYAMKALLPHVWGWEYFLSSPVIESNTLYIGGGDGYVYALDAANGKLKWNFKTGGRIRSTPLIQNKKLYIGSFDGYLYALDKDNGHLIWKFETHGVTLDSEKSGWDRISIDASPVSADGKIIFGSRDGYVYALDEETGHKIWETTYGPTWAIAAATISEGTVYVGWSDNFLFTALDLSTGKEKWKYQCGYYVYTKPVIINDKVIVGSHDGNVYLFDKYTGKKLDQCRTEAAVLSSPVIDQQKLFIGSDDGRMYCFSLLAEQTVRKAVYASKDPAHQRWLIDPLLAPYLVANGFELLSDTIQLAAFINEAIMHDQPTTLVFGTQRIPVSLLSPSASSGLMRKYLETGARVVWPGNIPNIEQLDSAGRFIREDVSVAGALLNMSFDITHDAGWYYSSVTAEGKKRMLPDWLINSYSVPQQKDLLPLMINEYNRASVWIRYFHPNKKGGFIQARTWETDKRMKDADRLFIKRLALL